jgi:hypothetical protein
MVRRFLLSLALLLTAANVGRADFLELSSIQTWVGSGSNEAGFVVDWKTSSGDVSLAWGYRWNGTATGEDMLRALAGANVGLYSTLGNFGSFGYAVFGLGYDLDGNGQFGVTPPLTFTNGISTLASASDVDPSRAPTEPGDLYQEDWWTGYWSYWTKSDSQAPWVSSDVGMSDRILTNGSWDGWSFAAGYDASPPANPVAAVPEPASILLLAMAGPAFVLIRRRKK